MPHFERAAACINSFEGIAFVVCINTVGNALVVDFEAEQPLIHPKGGFGGIGGGLVKYTALANVKKMRELLRPDIDVVGVGGVRTGRDAFELILCGASAVQVGTLHWSQGPACFDRIEAELRQIMQEKGYSSLEEFRNKLKPYDAKRARDARKLRKQKEGASSAPASGSTASPNSGAGGGNLPVYICAVLLAVIAILVADRQLLLQKVGADPTLA